jgi:hypothetical protein
MIFAYIILGFSAIVASFIVGAHYGRAAEQIVMADLFKTQATLSAFHQKFIERLKHLL